MEGNKLLILVWLCVFSSKVHVRRLLYDLGENFMELKKGWERKNWSSFSVIYTCKCVEVSVLNGSSKCGYVECGYRSSSVLLSFLDRVSSSILFLCIVRSVKE